MIHVHTYKKLPKELTDCCDIPQDESYLNFRISGKELTQLQIILARALNTASPEASEWKDWYEISDRLDAFIRTL